jgi:hypothetical protein
MKRIACLVVVTLCFAACSSHRGFVSTAPITLPQPPKQIAVHEEGIERSPETEYIDPPKKVSPHDRFSIPQEGAALLTPRSWRAVKYALVEWPKWAAAVKSIVDAHNQAVSPRDQGTWGWLFKGWD